MTLLLAGLLRQMRFPQKKKSPVPAGLFILVIIIISSAPKARGQDSLGLNNTIKEKLPLPFGTLAKMKGEIINGDSLNDKYHQSSFLLKIKSVDSLVLPVPVVLEFKDETGRFPAEVFGLYKYLHGKKTGQLSSVEIKKIKKQYVGAEFSIVAYEAGEFTGAPAGYYNYQPIRQDLGFYFRHYVIVVADLTERTD